MEEYMFSKYFIYSCLLFTANNKALRYYSLHKLGTDFKKEVQIEISSYIIFFIAISAFVSFVMIHVPKNGVHFISFVICMLVGIIVALLIPIVYHAVSLWLVNRRKIRK